MLVRILRAAAFVTALVAPLTVTNCANSSTNTNVTGNSNVAAPHAANAAGNEKGGEQEISRLLDEYNDALLKKDASVLDRIWADDLSFVNLRGQLLNKTERMENIKTGATELKSAKVTEKNVRTYGSTVVATLVVDIEGQYSGQEGSGLFRITTVWAKPKGSWQMVATQMTPVAK